VCRCAQWEKEAYRIKCEELQLDLSRQVARPVAALHGKKSALFIATRLEYAAGVPGSLPPVRTSALPRIAADERPHIRRMNESISPLSPRRSGRTSILPRRSEHGVAAMMRQRRWPAACRRGVI
jgi:hypothetical protein